jgi:hypothetical protein
MKATFHSLLVGSLFLAMAGPVAAQTSPGVKRTVVYAGHLLDVKTGSMLADHAIVIEGDRIVSS